ncbi:MAG: hypothetical protein QOG13_1865 [Sphingomonadales bacterium]|jgi:hypothetical protein|nr:hypothetical protein [Sphingomonadales bacterium]
MLKAGLFEVYSGLVEPGSLRRLQAEAQAARAGAIEAYVVEDRAAEWRGGLPARAFLTSPGGPVQDAFYRADWLAGILSRLTGHACAPTAGRGTFNYYARPGDHLALHRDVEGCDVAVITCLKRRGTHLAGGGQLLLYPECAGLPLTAARRRGAAATPVDLAEGQTVIMLGGEVPHRLLPLGGGQERAVSVLCFKFL